MTTAWQILHRAGVPLAGERTGPAPTGEAIARAVLAVIDDATPPAGREADALAAFVFAWRHHWPTEFDRRFGADGGRVLGWARSSPTELGRYVKLRRIAVSHLAEIF